MKFLSKKSDSPILLNRVTYQRNSSVNNARLRDMLSEEQSQFCAYTEKFLQPLDSVEVEHINSELKYRDNYYNYYSVIRNANLFKKDEKYVGASFFANLFFQKEDELNSRVAFSDNIYYEIDETDKEASDFIDFLNLNHPTLSTQRSNHVKRLKSIFQTAEYGEDEIVEYFTNHKEELSHITALEDEFKMSLISIVKQ